MNFQNKKLSINKKTVLVIVVAILVLTAGVPLFFWLQKPTKDQSNTEPRPAFTFNTTQAPGWYTGGNNWVNPDDFTGDQMRKDELPKADMSVHQGSNEQDIINGHCFTMAAYFDKSINVEDERKRKLTSTTADDGRIVTEVGVSNLKLATYEGVKDFQLHKYDISGPAAKDLQRGMADGYVQLSNGYVNIQSICQESAQLDETLPVFAATSLEMRSTER